MNKQYWLSIGLNFFFIIGFSSCEMKNTPKTQPLFVGTYTDNGSEGIYRYWFNTDTGELTERVLVATTGNPSYIEISPDKQYLYAVDETDSYAQESGSITVFKIDGQQLKALNTVSSFGAHPCHIGISKDGSMVAVSNYSGGTIAVYTTDGFGKLKEPQVIDHTILDSTETSHAHSALFPQGKLFVADLGLDVVNAYTVTNTNVEVINPMVLQLPEKAGPRHFVFSKDAEFLYVINELNSTITVYKGGSDGNYRLLETKSTLAENFSGESYCADIRLSPDGKFLYGSNRGENTIVIFGVDEVTGKLSLIGREDVRGDWPRNFNIDPSGNFLLVANQRSNNITVYKINKEKGTLDFAHESELFSPVCLKFL